MHGAVGREACVVDRRKSSQKFKAGNFVAPGDRSRDILRPVVCLSFATITEIPLQELSNRASSHASGFDRSVSFSRESLPDVGPEKLDGKEAEDETGIDSAIREEGAREHPSHATEFPTLSRTENQDEGANVNRSYADEES